MNQNKWNANSVRAEHKNMADLTVNAFKGTQPLVQYTTMA
jgi:hypothetical protein